MILGRFRVRPSTSRPPATFSKLDLHRTRKRLAIDRLPPDYERLVQTVGFGVVGGSNDYVRILSPDEVVERTARLRADPLPHPPPWSDHALLAGAVVIATFSFGDALVWFASRDRFVRIPVEPSHHPADLGSDLAAALDQALHVMGAPANLDLSAPYS